MSISKFEAKSEMEGYTAFSSDEPYRVSFTPAGMEITGKIADVESADALIATINALKMLLKSRPSSLTGCDTHSQKNEEQP